MTDAPNNIDEYLAALASDKRAALERLRRIIRAAAPRAEECVSYRLPAFRLNGKFLVAFGAGANHCAFYPLSSSTVVAHKEELRDYDTRGISGDSIHNSVLALRITYDVP